MNEHPVGYLSKRQDRAVGVFVCVLWLAMMVAFVVYLVSLP